MSSPAHPSVQGNAAVLVAQGAATLGHPEVVRNVVTDLPEALPVVPGETEAVLRAIMDQMDWILRG